VEEKKGGVTEWIDVQGKEEGCLSCMEDETTRFTSKVVLEYASRKKYSALIEDFAAKLYYCSRWTCN